MRAGCTRICLLLRVDLFFCWHSTHVFGKEHPVHLLAYLWSSQQSWTWQSASLSLPLWSLQRAKSTTSSQYWNRVHSASCHQGCRGRKDLCPWSLVTSTTSPHLCFKCQAWCNNSEWVSSLTRKHGGIADWPLQDCSAGSSTLSDLILGSQWLGEATTCLSGYCRQHFLVLILAFSNFSHHQSCIF